MRNLLFVFVSALFFVLVSCNDYGKKVKVSDNVEIYLHGNGVTEADAGKLGKYLAGLSPDSKNLKSFQLSKDSGTYVVKMVVDQDKLKTIPAADNSFMALKMLIETEVFNNQPVKLVLTDNYFKDLKSY